MSLTLQVRPGPPDHGRREHLTMAAAAAATLAVIVGSALLARGDLGGRLLPPEDPRVVLTDLGRQALDELPVAYQVDDAVIVPAATDPGFDWSSEVSADRIEGHAVPLGSRGLVPYGHLSSPVEASAWTRDLTADDRVYTDVGGLWFACTRWPGAEECEAALLVRHNLDYYFFKSGLGSTGFLEEGSPMEVFAFDSFDELGLRQLMLGGLDGTDTEDVVLTMEDGSQVTARTAKDLVAGETMWWTSVRRPVASATAYDGDGEVLQRVPAPDEGGILR